MFGQIHGSAALEERNNNSARSRHRIATMYQFRQLFRQNLLRHPAPRSFGVSVFDCENQSPWAGGVIVPLNNKLTAADLVYILNHSGTRFLLADEDFRVLIEDFPGNWSRWRKPFISRRAGMTAPTKT